MKKISLLKCLGLGFTSCAAISPLVLTATSCSAVNPIINHVISYRKFFDEKSLRSMSNDHYSNDELLLGTKKIFNGNYILFIGSNRYAGDNSTLSFFSGQGEKTGTNNRDINLWFTDYLEQSVWYIDVTKSSIIGTKIEQDFGFVTYLDNFDGKFYDKNNHEFYVTTNATKGFTVQNVGPFDKWNNTKLGASIEQTRQYMKAAFDYEWDKDKEVKETDYIRNDAQAVAFRKFVSRGAAFFPIIAEKREKTFDTSENNTTGLMVVYKNGRLVDIVNLPTIENKDPKEQDKGTTTLFGTINKYYTKEEDKD